MPDLSPASQKLLREIAKYDTGAGVRFLHAAYGRYSHPNTLTVYNRRSFFPLTGRGLVDDGGDDSAPVRITEAGRELAAELETQAAAQQAAEKVRAKPNPDGQAAQRLLREIAKYDEPARIYSDSRGPRVWSLGARNGYTAAINTWFALSEAGLIHIEYGFSGSKHATVTDAGLKRLAP